MAAMSGGVSVQASFSASDRREKKHIEAEKNERLEKLKHELIREIEGAQDPKKAINSIQRVLSDNNGSSEKSWIKQLWNLFKTHPARKKVEKLLFSHLTTVDQPVPRDHYNLGVLYLMGRGTPQDFEKAIECFKHASKRGIQEADYNLGLCAAKGQGQPIDHKLAMEYFEKIDKAKYPIVHKMLSILKPTERKIAGDTPLDSKGAAEIPATDERLALQYYLQAAKLNLLKTSRTAETGEIDIAAAGGSRGKLKISKDSIGHYSKEQIEQLEAENEKAKHLDLHSLKNLSPQNIKDRTIENFLESIRIVFEVAQSIKNDKSEVERLHMPEFIELIAKILGEGIVKDKSWFRHHDSRQYPYTRAAELKEAFEDFGVEFLNKLKQRPLSEPEQSQWAQRTAAWVEYRINLTDHFMTDSCGKVAAVMSTFVCILANHPLPVFLHKDEYLACAPKRPRIKGSSDDGERQYIAWEQHYKAKFLNDLESPRGILSSKQLSIPKEYGEAREYYKLNALDSMSLIGIGPSSLIDSFYRKLDNAVTHEFLKTLITEVLIKINGKFFSGMKPLGTYQITDFFRKDDDSYPCTKADDLKSVFPGFLAEVVDRLNHVERFNVIETLALIHYRVLHHRFFQEGNEHIAFALIVFTCMKLKIQLPRFLDPVKDFDRMDRHDITEKVISSDIRKDPQFSHWYCFYKSLFARYDLVTSQVNSGLISAGFKDGWDITIEEVLDKRFTIYEVGTRSFDEIEALKKATGLQSKELIAFRPSRILLHEIIVYVKTNLKIEEKEGEFESIVRKALSDKSITEKMASLDAFDVKKKAFREHIADVLEVYFHTVTAKKAVQTKVKKFYDLIQDRIQKGKCNIRTSESKLLMIDLIVDDLLRDFYKEEIKKIVGEYFSRHYPKDSPRLLTCTSNALRTACAIVGGPASGKSSLIRDVHQQMRWENDCCVLNPDDYKPLLSTDTVLKDDLNYAALVHEESSYISDEIITRLGEMVQRDSAPNILLDVVISENKMKVISHEGATVYLFVVSCPVEGPVGAVARAFNRARNEFEKGRSRYVPTTVILRGHQKESELLPDTIAKFKPNLTLMDTSERTPRIVATIDDPHNKQTTLDVYEPILFYNFLKKGRIYVEAAFEEQAYLKDLTGEDIAQLMFEYLHRGIDISFRYGNNIKNPVITRLEGEIQSSRTLISLLEKRENVKEEAELKKLDEELDSLKKKIGKKSKEQCEREIGEKEFKIKDLKEKPNVFATLSKDHISIDDVYSFSKIFCLADSSAMEDEMAEMAQKFLLFYVKNPIDGSTERNKFCTIHLYDRNRQLILKRDHMKNKTLCELVLKRICPIVFNAIDEHCIDDLLSKKEIKSQLESPIRVESDPLLRKGIVTDTDKVIDTVITSPIEDILQRGIPKDLRFIMSKLGITKMAQEADWENAVAQHDSEGRYLKVTSVRQEWHEQYRLAVERGDAAAQFNLGVCYAKGEGVEKDLKKAVEWFTSAAEQGDVDAQARLGFCYDKGEGVEKDLKKAAEWYKRAAEQGHAVAQNNLGVCYDQGKGVERDLKKAAEWYKRAGEQGHAVAQNNLGVCYDQGEGVERDPKKAAEWFTRATEQGDVDAQNNLGDCYYNGKGVERDPKKAAEWFTRAAEQGHAAAQARLGVCYDQGKGVERDPKKAAEWYKRAAEQGHAVAQFNLGVCYDQGKGVERDPKKAAEWFTRAAEQGDVDAQNNLGDCYDQGRGVERDLKKAAEWFTCAAEQGHAAAQARLGFCYDKGEGVEKDLKKAAEWYKRAAEQGDVDAQNNLGDCYYNGKGVKRDPKKAAEWFTRAAEQGDVDAQNNLGVCYYNGKGVKRDPKKAAEWFTRAAAQGHAAAQVAKTLMLTRFGNNADTASATTFAPAIAGAALSRQPGFPIR